MNDTEIILAFALVAFAIYYLRDEEFAAPEEPEPLPDLHGVFFPDDTAAQFQYSDFQSQPAYDLPASEYALLSEYTGEAPLMQTPKGYIPPSPEIAAAIENAAATAGVPADFLTRTAWLESRFRPNAGSDTGAKGLFQFIRSTWNSFADKYGEQFGITRNTDRSDINANSLLGAYHTKEGIDTFRAWYGREPTYGELYSLHFFGPEAKRLFDASPDAPMSQILPRVYNSSPTNKAALSRKDGTPLTAKELLAKHEAYYR